MRMFKLSGMPIVAVLIGAAWGLSACGRDNAPSPDGQVVAQVNGSEISVHQVQTVLQRQPALSAQLGEAAGRKVLDGLVEQELAAQAAREQKLENSPKVLQAMELAKREVLAREYQDQLADKAVPPGSEDIDRYYDAHPELFKARNQYTVRETALSLPPAEVAAWRDKVLATSSLAELDALLATSGQAITSREVVEWAENMPLGLLKQFAAMAPGHSVAVAGPDGLRIGTLLRAEPAPVNRRDAAPSIQTVLTNQRRREAVTEGMAALRKAARIQLMGAFAGPAASTPQTAPAAQ